MSNFITYGGNILANSNVTRAGIAYQRPIPLYNTFSGRDGDEPWHITGGTYDYTPPTNPISVAKLDYVNDDVLTLVENNAFGTKDRYTNTVGTLTYDGTSGETTGVTVDHLTGLMWDLEVYADSGVLTPTIHLTATTASSKGGFADWRVPSMSELVSIFDRNQYVGMLYYAPFDYNQSQARMFTCTNTAPINTTVNAQVFLLYYGYGTLLNWNGIHNSGVGMRVRNYYTSNVSPAQIGIAYRRPHLTGQVQTWYDGDDGWHLANGTYDYTPPANPTHTATLDREHSAPVYNLVENNAFGTKDRLTDLTGGTSYSDGYVIDHLTGLGYYNVAFSADTWENHLDEISGSTQNGYSDWRMPNANEYRTLQNFDGGNTQLFTITGIVSNRLQSSTTRDFASTTMFYWFYTTGYLTSRGKAGPDTTMMVRNHYN